MGYFATRVEAQRWLKIVLIEYPHAFVSEPPAVTQSPAVSARDRLEPCDREPVRDGFRVSEVADAADAAVYPIQ